MLDCRVDGFPDARVTWSRADRRGLPAGSSSSNGRLVMSNLQESDAGTYVCTADGPAYETVTARIEVTVGELDALLLSLSFSLSPSLSPSLSLPLSLSVFLFLSMCARLMDQGTRR